MDVGIVAPANDATPTKMLAQGRRWGEGGGRGEAAWGCVRRLVVRQRGDVLGVGRGVKWHAYVNAHEVQKRKPRLATAGRGGAAVGLRTFIFF